MVDTKNEKSSFIIICLLLFLRFGILYLSHINIIDSNIGLAIYLLGTFILTGLYICKNFQDLSRFNISEVAIFVFLASPIFSIIADPYNFIAYINIPISFLFGVYLFRNRKQIVSVKTLTNKFWSNVFITLFLITVIIIVGIFTKEFRGGDNLDPLNAEWFINQFLFQLSFAAIMEEPLFRGFLWGYLKKYNMSAISICLVQALLFWAGHIYYIDTGLNFWFFHPITAFILGLIIVKTKNIAFSLFAHAMVNTIAQIFMFYYKVF